jgi:hypothetical protein
MLRSSFAGIASKFTLVSSVVFHLKFSVVCRRGTCRLSLQSNRHGCRNRQASRKQQTRKKPEVGTFVPLLVRTSDDHTGAEECELVLELLGSVILRVAVDGNTIAGRLAGVTVCFSIIGGIIIVVESRMLGVLASQRAASQHEHHTFSISCFF